MPIKDRPSLAQQENILSLLAHDDEHGRIIASMVEAALFEGDYRELAIRILNHWKQ
jgi:hypothetical protein